MRQIFAATSLRLRPGWPLFMLAVAVAPMTMGAFECASREGLNRIGNTSDDALVVWEVAHGPESHPVAAYRSDDGGLTWQSESADGAIQAETGHGGNSTVAPGGVSYAIQGTDILRSTNDKREVVYDAGYLRDKANLALQFRATGVRELTGSPKSIIYDPASGNVVVVMGWEGVVVGMPDGRWRRVAVGQYAPPADFSAADRLKLMLTHLGFWVSAFMVAVSFPAVAIVLSRCRERELLLGALAAFAIPAIAVAVAALIILIAMGQTAALLLLLMVPIALMVAPIVLLKVWPVESSQRIGLALGLALLLAAGAYFAFPGFGIPLLSEPEFIQSVILAVTAVPATIVVIIAVIPYRPQDVKIWMFLLPSGAAMLSTVFVVLLWMLYVIPNSAAEWMALALAAGIALLTLLYLRRRQRRDQLRQGELPY